MALTVINTPDSTYLPVYNPIVFELNSTNKTVDNFKYLFTIEVDGVAIDKYFKVSPDPTNGYGLIDAKRVLETFVQNDVDYDYTGFVRRLNSWCKFRIGYGEEYGLLSSGVTQIPNQSYSAYFFAFNGSIKTNDWVNYADTSYLISTSSTTRKLLSNKPTTFRIQENQYDWTSFISSTDNAARYLTVKTYNSSGSLLNTFKINNSYPLAGSNDNQKFMRVITGWNLNLIDNGEFNTGSQPVLDDNVSYYKWYLESSSNNQVSQEYTYKIQRQECDYDQAYDIIFLNNLGGYDSVRFNKFNSTSYSINRKDYKKAINLSGNASWSFSERGKTQYYTDYTEKMTLRSMWLNDDESEWLYQLISSPDAYLWDYNTEFLTAINITNTEWEQKSVKQGNVFNVTLNIEFSERNYRQRF